jgi:hypothetical protein
VATSLSSGRELAGAILATSVTASLLARFSTFLYYDLRARGAD